MVLLQRYLSIDGSRDCVSCGSLGAAGSLNFEVGHRGTALGWNARRADGSRRNSPKERKKADGCR